MNTRPKKVVIISLDGATFDILNPLMKQGLLPNLRRLQEKGLATPLASIVPPVTPPAWTSFMTGKQPSKHGIFGFMHFDPTQYSWQVNNSRYIHSKTIWHILSEKEKRVIVINLPQTYPPYPVNGVMVSGWDSVSSDFTYPSNLAEQIRNIVPGYDSNLWLTPLMPAKSREEFDQFIGKLNEGAKQSATLAVHLLEENPWDVFMLHFHQTDWIQHKLWPDIQRALIAGNRDYRAERVRECYQCVDESLGAVLRQTADEDPLVVVLSDHGFGPHRGHIYANYYLQSWGYLDVEEPAENGGALSRVKNLFRNSRRASLRAVYNGVAKARHAFDREESVEEYKQKYSSWVDLSTQNSSQRGRNINWLGTRVALIEQYHCAFLYVNAVGRGPQGIVEPSEYEAIVSDLLARFREIRHPLTGEKLLARAERCRDIYPAANPDVLLPDIVLIPVDGYNFDAAISSAPPEPTSEGIHHPRGILFLQGSGLDRSVDLQPTLVDVAPSILHYMGIPVPSDMDGRVLEEMFLDSGPVSYEGVDNAVAVGEPVPYSAADSFAIEERLRGLGYIE